jgi:hypothetical protein
MRFDVYCDESFPDLLSSSKPKHSFLMIGSLWLPTDSRTVFKDRISAIREKYQLYGEIKWHKVSRKSLEFNKELIDLFIDSGSDIRFRCIAVDRSQVKMNLLQNDAELGFYKFYYQLLHHWILDFNEYRIFCDIKTNRSSSRIYKLKQYLSCANLSSKIIEVQSLPSEEVVLIQLSDLLLGCASTRINQTTKPGSIREQLVLYLENRLGRRICPTFKDELKFNIFKIQLGGGWND